MQNVDAINSGNVEKPINYLTNGYTIKSWLLKKDHKRIAIMYLIVVSIFFLMGGLYAATIRLKWTPQSDLLASQKYTSLHANGILMIFFFRIRQYGDWGEFSDTIMIVEDCVPKSLLLVDLYDRRQLTFGF